MTAIRTTDYFLEVARGNVAGSSSGFIVGRNPDVGNTATETLWDQGGQYTYLTANTQLYASSTSASDTTVTLFLSGLDDSYNPMTQTVTLNGQSQAAFSSADGFRVHTVTVTGSTSPIGDVYIAETDTLTGGVPDTATKIKAKIALSTDTINGVIDTGTRFASSNITHLGLYTVPLGKTMRIVRILSTSGKDDNVKLGGKVKLFGGVWLDRNPNAIYQSTSFIDFDPALSLPEKADLEFTAIAGSVNSLSQAQAFFILDDN